MKAQKNKRLSIITAALVLFVAVSLSAQSKIGLQLPAYKAPQFSFLKLSTLKFDKKIPYQLDPSYQISTYRVHSFNSPLAEDVLKIAGFLENFNHKSMPFFCEIEFQMEQASGFPVKFRLGDVQYVDRLEGKGNYVAPASW